MKVVLGLIVLGIFNYLIWYYLPEEDKQTVKDFCFRHSFAISFIVFLVITFAVFSYYSTAIGLL
jgi:quinol-cytochrome oxidoreductase complex cytochrome b subunit